MITIGYSTREHNPKFIEYLKKSSGFKKVEVIEKINNGEKSLSEIYNEIISESKTDMVVLCHDDIYFDTSSWYYKLKSHFENSDYGILGVAGTTEMPTSGQWWEVRRKMIGIVNHESGGKKWTSKYSEDLGKSIRETVIVDGVFIALSKTRIKHNFDEEFKGFHFYDIGFCFKNQIEGVKVGVISNIRITHKSIGQTNQQWEENKNLFTQKYSEILPIKIPFDPNRKLKVLLSCISFRNFTGSELYVFELAKSLIKLNCSVTVLSQIGGPVTDMANKLGIKCVSFENAPGFKLGDGQWGMNTPEGFKPSTPNTLYRVSDVDYDIIHFQHKPVAERILSMYPELPKISAIHSEVISLEDPVVDPTIKKYIAIRPEIKEHMINNFDIPEEMIEVIYNPVDNEKFQSKTVSEENYVLFVGTIDYLRKETILDLIEYTRELGKELWLVGENNGNYLENVLLEDHVKHFPSTWKIEDFILKSYETAGIQLGRTTIESWMCGKSSWIYKVDKGGFILSKEKFDPPSDIEKYHTLKVAQQIKDEYIKILS
jgi:Glycosyltransferase like family/Glycosyltransferase Family 4